MAAMTKEIDQIRSLLEDEKEIRRSGTRLWQGKIAGKEVLLTQSGIGKVCAATNALEIIREYKPQIVLNTGVAGSLAKNVEVKDIVIGTDFAYHDVWCLAPNLYGQMQGFPASFETDANLIAKLKKTFDGYKKIHFGLVCTGDRFICYPSDVVAVLEHFPDVAAVDMEATAIAQICYMHKCKFLSIKVISDNPVLHPNGVAQYDGFWHELVDISFENIVKIIKAI